MPTSKRRKLIAPAAITVGTLISGLLVWQSSYAAFTATTDSKDNTFASGDVVLSNDTSGARKFNATNLVPMSIGSECITVDYTGSAAADIRFAMTYGTGRSAADTPFAYYLRFSIEELAESADCATAPNVPFLTANARASQLITTTATTPLSTWSAAADTSGTRHDKKKYRIRYIVDVTLSNNTMQNQNATLNFVWTAKSVVTP